MKAARGDGCFLVDEYQIQLHARSSRASLTGSHALVDNKRCQHELMDRSIDSKYNPTQLWLAERERRKLGAKLARGLKVLDRIDRKSPLICGRQVDYIDQCRARATINNSGSNQVRGKGGEKGRVLRHSAL